MPPSDTNAENNTEINLKRMVAAFFAGPLIVGGPMLLMAALDVPGAIIVGWMFIVAIAAPVVMLANMAPSYEEPQNPDYNLPVMDDE